MSDHDTTQAGPVATHEDPRDPDPHADDPFEALGSARDPDSLGGHLDRNFLMAGRRRVSLIVLTGVLALGLLTVAFVAFTSDTAQQLGTSSSSDFTTTAEGFAEAESPSPGTAEPVLDAATTGLLDAVAVVTAGDGPRVDRIVLEPDPTLLPAAPSTIAASVLTFKTRPHVAVIGAPGWLETACVQVTVLDASGAAIDTAWLASPVSACSARGVGRAAVATCASDRAVMIPLLSGEELGLAPAQPWTVLVDLIGQAEGYESILVSSELGLVGEADELVPSRADRGQQLTFGGVPEPAGGDDAGCVVQ